MPLRKSLVGVLVSALLILPVGLAQARPAAPATPANVPVPITGTLPGGGTFTGVFTLTNVVVQNGALTAVGTLSGTLKNALGDTIGTVTDIPVRLGAAVADATCQILHLELGPLDLNLLGLMVHLDQVVLDITAQQGPGNLLGNLLCAVAHLLDNTGNPLGGLAALLNSILGQL